MVQLKFRQPYGINAGPVFDSGTSCLAPSPLQGPVGIVAQGNQAAFDGAIRALEAEVSNAGAFLVVDAAARRAYARLIRQMSDDLAAQVRAGGLTWGAGSGAGKPGP